MQQDDRLDELIREAAAQHQPAARLAWNKMEAKLDAHMPQRSRGRAAVWLFLLMIAGISTGILLLNQTNSSVAKSNTDRIQNPGTTIASINSTDINVEPVSILSEKPAESNTDIKSVAAAYSNPIANEFPLIKPSQNQFTLPGFMQTRISEGLALEDEEELTDQRFEYLESNTDKKLLEENNSKNILPADEPVKHNTPGKKKKSNPLQKLSFNVTMGPDISFVKVIRPVSTGIVAGAGINYQVNKRFTVSTGLYVNNKSYSADSANYHPPASFWGNYNNLQKVNGNCTVFEIPVSATYNFKSKGRNNLFVSAGMSSYLMKKENYTYSYKNSLGQPDKRDFTVNNQNKHAFSVLTVSGGLQTTPQKAVSFRVEPYLKLPVQGVGFGKINLNSTGVLFTIQVNPFIKN